MGTIVQLHRPPECVCGQPGKRRVEVAETGERADIIACDACYGETWATLDRVRPVFEKMLECGVEKDTASEVMTYLLDRVG